MKKQKTGRMRIVSYNDSFADKLLNSNGREQRRALFSLKQIFQVNFSNFPFFLFL